MKLGEVVVHMGTNYYNNTKFHKNLMKDKKVPFITKLSDGPFIKG